MLRKSVLGYKVNNDYWMKIKNKIRKQKDGVFKYLLYKYIKYFLSTFFVICFHLIDILLLKITHNNYINDKIIKVNRDQSFSSLSHAYVWVWTFIKLNISLTITILQNICFEKQQKNIYLILHQFISDTIYRIILLLYFLLWTINA